MSNVVINESVLRIAILDIYNELNIPATGRLTLAHLEEEWKETGLRLDDLVRGVNALIADGDLLIATINNERCLKLTEQGYNHMTANPSPTMVRDRILATHALSQAQKRRHKRRQSDAGNNNDTPITSGEDDLSRRLRAIPDQAE